MNTRLSLAALATLALAGCAAPPLGPTVSVMPSPGMPFERFQEIDASCRNYAAQSISGTQQSANNSALESGAAGALIGAAAGALIGGNHNGAATGAGIGLLAGSAGGANNYNASQYGAQRQYNLAYQQCMYAKGAQVPGYAAPSYAPPPVYAPPPAPGYAPPPPPQR